MERISKYDKEEIQFEARMRLIEGIIKQVLDEVSISNKWKNKDISLVTLLHKRKILRKTGQWMKTWQWRIWVNIWSEHNGHNNKEVIRRMESIRKRSVKHVNARIYEKNKNTKAERENQNTTRKSRNSIQNGQEKTKNKNKKRTKKI